MPNTFTLISSSTVGSGGATDITFSSIPQTYTDLVLKISGRTSRSAANDYLRVVFNSSSSGYANRNAVGTGTSTASETNNSTTYGFTYGLNGNTALSNTFGSIDIYIPNYTLSINKSWSNDSVQENNTTAAQLELNANLWSNTSAITSILISSHDLTKTFLQYTTAYLYGIKKD